MLVLNSAALFTPSFISFISTKLQTIYCIGELSLYFTLSKSIEEQNK